MVKKAGRDNVGKPPMHFNIYTQDFHFQPRIRYISSQTPDKASQISRFFQPPKPKAKILHRICTQIRFWDQTLSQQTERETDEQPSTQLEK